jgi:hypothetical protein
MASAMAAPGPVASQTCFLLDGILHHASGCVRGQGTGGADRPPGADSTASLPLNRRIAVRARYGFAHAFRWLFMKRESAQAASIAADLLELERAVEVGWRDVALLDHNSEFQR